MSIMGHQFGTAVLIVTALFFLATMWSSGTNPEGFAEQLGLKIANAGGVNEIRAQYAGFFLAAAVVCLAPLMGALSRRASFIVLLTIFGGLLAGRLVSLAINGDVKGYPPTIVALYAIDAIGLVLAIAAFNLDSPARE
jgi:hypothetical protein